MRGYTVLLLLYCVLFFSSMHGMERLVNDNEREPYDQAKKMVKLGARKIRTVVAEDLTRLAQYAQEALRAASNKRMITLRNLEGKYDMPLITMFSGGFDPQDDVLCQLWLDRLLALGADANPACHPLVFALVQNRPVAIASLIRHGSHIQHAGLESATYTIGNAQYTPRSLMRMRQELFFKAAAIGSIPVMRQLLEAEPTRMIQNKYGHALFYTLRRWNVQDHEKILKELSYLLSQGANPFYETYEPVLRDCSKENYYSQRRTSPYRKFMNKHFKEAAVASPHHEQIGALLIEERKRYLDWPVMRLARLLNGKGKATCDREAAHPTDPKKEWHECRADNTVTYGPFAWDLALLIAKYRYNYPEN